MWRREGRMFCGPSGKQYGDSGNIDGLRSTKHTVSLGLSQLVLNFNLKISEQFLKVWKNRDPVDTLTLWTFLQGWNPRE